MKDVPNPTEADPHSASALWETFHEGLRGFVFNRIPSNVDAEDVLQEIFLRIHKGASGIQKRDRVQAWVYAVARAAIADFYRTRHQQARVSQAGGVDPPEPGEAPSLPNQDGYEGDHDVHEEVLSWLLPMIEELPEKYRTALILADVKGYRQQDVAEELGLSLSGAKSRVQRARVMLGEVLQTCCSVEFGTEGRVVGFSRLQGRKKRQGPDHGECAT